MEEAIAWLKRCPNPMTDDSKVEIRPIFSPEDVEAITQELRQQEERERAEIAATAKHQPRRMDVRGQDDRCEIRDS